MNELDRFIERQSLLPTTAPKQKSSYIKCLSSLCSQSKAATLIIVWTVLIGVVYTMMNAVAATLIANHIMDDDKVESVVTYPVIILYAILAILAMLYPLIGFIADVSCGPFKVVIVCFCLVLFSYSIAYVCLMILWTLAHYNSANGPAYQVVLTITCIAALTTLIGVGGYQANFIQLGLDQQLSAPSKDLALFVHWAMWAYNFGCTIVALSYQPYICSATTFSEKAVIAFIPLFLIAFFILVSIITCLKRHWFTSEIRPHNPCNVILSVLNFARKYKFPLGRSAFTYSDDKRPTRLDFAKKKFGGYFTTEQVEDTKSFFKILAVLFALGPVFVLDMPSSFMGVMLFGYHTGNFHILNGTQAYFSVDHCSSWVLIWSGNLKYMLGTLLFPVYVWIIFSFLHQQIPRMFSRLIAGITVYLLGNFCLLITDLAGHASATSQNSNSSLCVFSTTLHLASYGHLNMHWAVMLAPSILLGVGPLVVMTTALEFISAQSPHFMKGLLVGLLFAIIGLFQLISALAFIPFSATEIWNTTSMRQNPPITNCGFGYVLFNFTVALVGFVIFLLVARKYSYRVRDDEPYNQSQVEEIISRYLERPVHKDD